MTPTRLQRLRLAAGLSQSALAERVTRRGVPVTQAHLSLLERGQHEPSLRLARAVAAALGVFVEEVWPPATVRRGGRRG